MAESSAKRPRLTAVKQEEPEEDGNDADAEAFVVPPGVVLDKLEALLTTGRNLLRFLPKTSAALDASWGVNGRLEDRWCSFKVGRDGACEFRDDSPWATEASGEWAESELEQLERLRADAAARTPCTTAAQPSAARPRLCRQAAFAYHRAAFARRQASAVAAREAAAAPARTARLQAGPKPPALPPQANARAAAAGSGAAVAGSSASAAPGRATVAKAAGAEEAPVAGESGFAGLMKQAKVELPKAQYIAFLKAVQKDAQDAVLDILQGFPRLGERYRKLKQQRQSAANAKGASAGAAASAAGGAVGGGRAAAPKGAPKAAAAKPAVPSVPAVRQVDVEEEVLKPLRDRGGDAATQLVNLVLGGRRNPARLRRDMLRYVRSSAAGASASAKEIILIRGPPGTGKTAWAMEQLEQRVLPAKSEEYAARLTHICSIEDFSVSKRERSMDEDEGYLPEREALDPDRAELASARNEARVRLAAEAGVPLIFVDACHMQLWEMGSHVGIAEKAGYEVTVVSPDQIFSVWKDASALQVRLQARYPSTTVSRAGLQAVVDLYESGLVASEIVAAIRATKRPAAPPLPPALQIYTAAAAEGNAEPAFVQPPAPARLAKTSPTAVTADSAL